MSVDNPSKGSMKDLRRPKSPNPTIALAALLGMASVALGAFGAHALRGVLDEAQQATYQTATTYQMWHALALLGIGILESLNPPTRLLKWSRNTMFMGTIAFSGSLYLLVLTGVRAFGFVTPVGGCMLLMAWLLLAINQWRYDRNFES